MMDEGQYQVVSDTPIGHMSRKPEFSYWGKDFYGWPRFTDLAEARNFVLQAERQAKRLAPDQTVTFYIVEWFSKTRYWVHLGRIE